jgi:hypothetical protein
MTITGELAIAATQETNEKDFNKRRPTTFDPLYIRFGSWSWGTASPLWLLFKSEDEDEDEDEDDEAVDDDEDAKDSDLREVAEGGGEIWVLSGGVVEKYLADNTGIGFCNLFNGNLENRVGFGSVLFLRRGGGVTNAKDRPFRKSRVWRGQKAACIDSTLGGHEPLQAATPARVASGG